MSGLWVFGTVPKSRQWPSLLVLCQRPSDLVTVSGFRVSEIAIKETRRDSGFWDSPKVPGLSQASGTLPVPRHSMGLWDILKVPVLSQLNLLSRHRLYIRQITFLKQQDKGLFCDYRFINHICKINLPRRLINWKFFPGLSYQDCINCHPQDASLSFF